jgi:hypothetical protein
MQIKVIEILNLTTTAVTTVSRILDIYRKDNIDDIQELDADRWLALNGALEMVRTLFGAWPDEIKAQMESEDAEKVSGIYLHNFKVDNIADPSGGDNDRLYNLLQLDSAFYDIHSAIYNEYWKARNALDLYS